jgi:hypothetical protein
MRPQRGPAGRADRAPFERATWAAAGRARQIVLRLLADAANFMGASEAPSWRRRWYQFGSSGLGHTRVPIRFFRAGHLGSLARAATGAA